MARRVTAHVPATTANLGPGFDCLGMALQLYNTIELEVAGSAPLTIQVAGSCAPDSIALDESNLVFRAAQKVFDLAGNKPGNLTIRVALEAPLARGLGSSASAIVGGMAAANSLLGSPIPEQELLTHMVAMEGHPDNVVPCFVGQLTASIALSSGVSYIRRTPHSDLRCVLLVPDYELATSKARAAIPKSIPLKDAVFNLSRTAFVLDRIESGNFESLAEIMDDRLHQPYRRELIKAYDAIEQSAMQAGAAAVCISGAGPTILAITKSAESHAVADAMQTALETVGSTGRALIVKPDRTGTRIETE
jgi:homoserine kinase